MSHRARTTFAAMVVCAWPCVVQAASVLPPTAGDRIQAAFAAAAPAWQLTRGDVGADSVQGAARTPGGTTVPFTLGHDNADCVGQHAGSFCLTLGPGADAAETAALVAALAALPASELWIEVRPRGDHQDAPAAATATGAAATAGGGPDQPRAHPGHLAERDPRRRGATFEAATALTDHGAVMAAMAAGALLAAWLLLRRPNAGR